MFKCYKSHPLEPEDTVHIVLWPVPSFCCTFTYKASSHVEIGMPRELGLLNIN